MAPPMHIPTPEELDQRLAVRDEDEVSAVAKRILDRLYECYEGGSSTLTMAAGSVRPRVRRQVEALFRGYGWQITYTDDQRDEPYWAISRAPKTEGYRDI